MINLLAENKNFDQAFKVANTQAKHKVQDVHLLYAMHLEDIKDYK